MKRDEKILHELYRRSFAASEPKGDWDKLFAEATVNEKGEKEIPFMDYIIEDVLLKQIFNDTMKEFKIPKRRRPEFAFSFYLGCSPKSRL